MKYRNEIEHALGRIDFFMFCLSGDRRRRNEICGNNPDGDNFSDMEDFPGELHDLQLQIVKNKKRINILRRYICHLESM